MDEKNAIKVLIATAEHDITGYLYAPNASEMDSKKKKAEAPGQKILLLIEVRRHTVFLYAYYIISPYQVNLFFDIFCGNVQ